MNKYYVYVHIDNKGDVVYVGKGSNKRAYQFSKSKSSDYLVALEENGGKFTVVKLFENLTYNEATDLEIETFNNYLPNGKLLNGRKPSKVKQINFDEISSKLRYDETSPTMLRWIGSGHNIVNNRVAGSKHSQGYFEVRVNLQLYLVHRVVWVLNGNLLDDEMVIDHIDGNRLNNRISNLRQVKQEINSQNSSIKSNNKTGVVGVSYCVGGDRFLASCESKGVKFKKSFACNKYGKDNALNLAINWRKQLIDKLNQEGADYTERHQNL